MIELTKVDAEGVPCIVQSLDYLYYVDKFIGRYFTGKSFRYEGRDLVPGPKRYNDDYRQEVMIDAENELLRRGDWK